MLGPNSDLYIQGACSDGATVERDCVVRLCRTMGNAVSSRLRVAGTGDIRMSGMALASCLASFVADYLVARYRYLPRRAHRLRRGSRSLKLIYRPRRRRRLLGRIIADLPSQLGGILAPEHGVCYRGLAVSA